jgi:hypothetical protein
MTPSSRFALLAALALLATPLVTAQHGPPPGYTDPLAYTQDYAANQTTQATTDPAGYAAAKGTPEALGAEAEHAAWLACWTAHEADEAGMALDPVCSQFFTAPGVVDPPAPEATAEITETLEDADALVGEVQGAAEGLVEDPTTAVEQVQRILDAVVAFVEDLVGGLLDALGLGGLAIADGLAGMLDGLLALLQLPALGVKASLDGLGLGLGAVGDGVAVAATGLADAVLAVVDGLAAAAGAAADGLAAVATGFVDGLAAAGSATADASSAVAGAVGDGMAGLGDAIGGAASAIGDALASLFDGGDAAGADDGLTDAADGLETGTEADGLVDRVRDLL